MESREPNYGNRIEQILGSVTGDYTGELDAPSARIEYLVKKIKANIATGASDEDIKVAITDALKDYVKRSDVQPDTNTTYTFKQDVTDPNKFIFEGSDGTKAEVNIPKTTVPTKLSELENDTGFITADSIPEAPDLSPYALKTEIPKNVSEFINDAGYVTESVLATKVSDSEATKEVEAHKALEEKETYYPTTQVVEDLPTEKIAHKIFFKKEGDEWIGYTWNAMSEKYSSFVNMKTNPSQYSNTDLAVMILWGAILGE